jgi:hypothetical protein
MLFWRFLKIFLIILPEGNNNLEVILKGYLVSVRVHGISKGKFMCISPWKKMFWGQMLNIHTLWLTNSLSRNFVLQNHTLTDNTFKRKTGNS